MKYYKNLLTLNLQFYIEFSSVFIKSWGWCNDIYCNKQLWFRNYKFSGLPAGWRPCEASKFWRCRMWSKYRWNDQIWGRGIRISRWININTCAFVALYFGVPFVCVCICRVAYIIPRAQICSIYLTLVIFGFSWI